MEEFITIKENIQSEFVEKKSKFITHLFYINSVEEAEKLIKYIRKKYFDARHNCIAYRVIEDSRIVEKSSDDGEPSGTAGAPMLNILQKNNLLNVLVVVTRYFGGVLLGTGGLVRAYSTSLLNAIEKSTKVAKCEGQEFEVNLEYSQLESFKHYCRINGFDIVNVEYSQDIVCKIQIEERKKDILLEDFKTKKIFIKNIRILSKKYIDKSI